MEFNVKVNLVNKPGSVKAFASVNINEEFAVTGLRVIEGEKGLFVSMPSRKTENGYEDVAFPITAECREKLNKTVMEAYEQKLSQQEAKTNEKGKDGKKSGKNKSQKQSAEQKADENGEEMSEEGTEQTEAGQEIGM